MTLAKLDPFASSGNDQTSTTAASLRFLLLGDVGVGRSAFIDTFISTLEGINSNVSLEEHFPQPNTVSSASPQSFSLPTVHVQTAPVIGDSGVGAGAGARARAGTEIGTGATGENSTSASLPLDDPLGLMPPKVQTPSRDLWFVTLPGYSSTTNPSSVLSMTDDYLNHHLITTTSIFSPTIASAQLAWFLMAGARAHTLPTVAFYFVLYELKPIDILYMKLIHERVNLVPIITKADTVSSRELWILKRRMIRQLKLNEIQFHTFGMDMETVETMANNHQRGAVPFAVSTRRDEEGRLVQSELGHLIKLCVYEQFRHSQEEAARKVVEWRRAFGPSAKPPTTVAEKVWGERQVIAKVSRPDLASSLAADTRPTELTALEGALADDREYEAQFNSLYTSYKDTSINVSSPVQELSTKPSYGTESLYMSPTLLAAQARLSLIHETTGMSVDPSDRPNIIMDDKVNTVQAVAQGQQFATPGGAGNEGSKFKVEIPNSYYKPLPAINQQPQQQQYHQLSPDGSFAMAGGYQPPGTTYLVPDLYQAALLSMPGEQMVDIWEATELGDITTVQKLLNNGVSPDQRNTSRSTLLHRAAWQGSRPFAMMSLLISYGANVNLANENGNTVLQNVLMKHDDPALIKLLLDNGAETNIPNKEGMNTLEVAALFNKLDSAKYLLEHDLASSEPLSIVNALARTRNTDKKVMKTLLKSWQGKEGEKRRSDLAERLLNPNQQYQQQQQQPSPIQGHAASVGGGGFHTHDRSLSQLQNQSQSQITDSTSVHSVDTHKGGDGNATSSKASSIHYEGTENGTGSSSSISTPQSSGTQQSKHTSRFNLKTMRAAAPSMSNLFSRKP
ncbi:hypothetical protein BGZ83_010811 [Gryganskiella cystojenkinii]|nr:hypothetical protein BGZ83_010811 [Gryganskiella cystojenkinii]